MTQVYQHEEDGERGDFTISRLLGIKGTFQFTALMFTLAVAGFWFYLSNVYNNTTALMFLAFMVPVLVYFLNWYLRVHRSETAADFKSTMRLNFISATSLNLFFLYLWFY